MNAKHLVAAFAVFAATGSVLAQDFVTPDANVASTRTRAEVIAEVAQARANGTLEIRETTYPGLPVTASSKTRAEVLAELEQYKKAYPNGQDIYRN